MMEWAAWLKPLADFFVLMWQESAIKVIVVNVMVNVLVGLMASIMTGRFSFQKVWEFVYKKMLPLGGTYAICWAFGRIVPELVPVAVVSLVAIEAKLLADLVESLGEMGMKLGVPLPEGLRKVVEKSDDEVIIVYNEPECDDDDCCCE